MNSTIVLFFALILILSNCSSSKIKEKKLKSDKNNTGLTKNIDSKKRVKRLESYRLSLLKLPDAIIPERTTPVTRLPFTWDPLKLSDLHNASKNGNIKLLKSLIKNGNDVDAKDNDGMTPLHYASEWGHLRIIQHLLKKGADVNARNVYGSTPLSYTSNGRIAEFLIRNGADVNSRNKWGETPLFWASEYGNINMVKISIRKGGRVNTKGFEDDTPLHYAVKYSRGRRHLNIIGLLLKNGARINSKNKYGWTPLHGAVEKGKFRVAKKLIKSGANVNALTLKDNEKFNIVSLSSPLHIAIKEFDGSLGIINLLIKNGSNIMLKNNNGLTPIELALRVVREPTSNWYGTARYKRKKREGLKKVIKLLKRISEKK